MTTTIDAPETRRPGACRDLPRGTTLPDAVAVHGFDASIGGARRDVDTARAKKRILSLRDPFGQWDPRHQHPELWHLHPGRVRTGEHLRTFPIPATATG
ncbi:MAG TPA: hypothetical protein VMV22_05430 [Acidimicrobiales bacterium]|nr:hypothetical protein [Acidimicrobiales bacterium]